MRIEPNFDDFCPMIPMKESSLDGHLSTMEVHPGDVIVCRVDQEITIEQVKRMENQFLPIFPSNKVLVLGKGISLGVVHVTKDSVIETVMTLSEAEARLKDA